MFTLPAVSTTRGTTLEKINLCWEKGKMSAKGEVRARTDDNNNTAALQCQRLYKSLTENES